MNTRIDRRLRRSLTSVALFLVIAASVHVSADAQAARQFLGRPVAEVLRQLQAEGARIIFSSALVPAELRVSLEPRATEPREIAREILAPHRLTLKDGPGNTWLVVRQEGAAPPAPRERERDDAAQPREHPASQESAGQTEIRIEERVDVTGLDGLATQPSVQKVNPATVLNTAGSLENLFQVLPTLPGAAATNDEEGKLAVRGGGPEHNVVVFDGVQIHSPQRAGDFGTSFVNPAVTAGVAFDASGLDARHGGRLSSVTVLETRNGATDRRVALSGSVGLTSGDVLVEGRLPGTESGSWWAAARGTYYKFVAERFRDEGVPGFADLQFKVHVRPTPRTELSLLGLVGEESMVQRWSAPADPSIGGGNIRRELDGDNRLAAINLQWTPGPRMTAITTVTAYASAFRYQDHLIVPLRGSFDRDVTVADVAVRQRAAVAWSGGHLLDVGVEARRLKSSWAMTGSAPATLVRPLGPDTWGGSIEYDGPIDSRLTKTLLGAWVQDRVPLGAGLAIEPGARVDWNSLTGESALQPRVRLTKRLGRTVLWAGLAWQSQTPGHETMQQGYSFFDLTGGPEASGLRNERSRQLVVGVERETTRGVTIRIEAYRRAFDRLLVQRQETDAERDDRLSRFVVPPDMRPDSAILEYRPTVHPESTGTGRATGLELLLQRSSGRVTGWLSYTLSKAERELYGRTVPFDFDRRHAVAIALNLQLSSRIRLSATSQYATGFALTPLHPEPVFPELNQIFPLPTPPFTPARKTNGDLLLLSGRDNPLRLSLLNSARMPPYARTDARVSFALATWLEVYGEVINLFGRENFHPKAEFRSDVVAQYEVAPSLPRLPTYGVRLKF